MEQITILKNDNMVKLFLPSGPKKIQINPINNYYDIKIHEKLHLNKARITFSLFSEMEKGRFGIFI